jgi:hypothetical protein
MPGVPPLSRRPQAPPPATVGVVLLLIAGACARSPAVPATDPDPQRRSGASSADSAAVLAVVGAELRSEHPRRLIDRFQCGASDPRCVEIDGWRYWTPTVEPLLSDLAHAAGAEFVRPDWRRVPPCPWNAGTTEPVGYAAWLPHPVVRGDSAVVHVRLSCRDATNPSNRSFYRERQYSLTREGATWRIVATSLLRSR